MLLRVVDGNEFRDIPITEGSLFLLPRTFPTSRCTLTYCLTFYAPPILGNVPHNPVRFAGTVGIVIEGERFEGSKGRLTSRSLVDHTLTLPV